MRGVVGGLLYPGLLCLTIACSGERPGSQEACAAPASQGRVDHVSVAVADLEAAVSGFAARGFSVRPGRPHPNSIRNAFVEWADGTEIELITATRADDEVSAGYVEFLQRGEGGAFLALRADSLMSLESDAAEAALDPEVLSAGGFDYLTFGRTDLAHVFLFRGPMSSGAEAGPHPNGAEGLAEVWIDASDGWTRLMEVLGARACGRRVAPAGESGSAYALGSVWVVLTTPAAGTGRDSRARVRGVTLWTRSDSVPDRIRLNGVWFDFRRIPPGG